MTAPPLPEALPAGEQVERTARLQLEPEPEVVQRARSFVAEQAPALSADTLAVLILLTSELVTNAVVHARTPLEVGVTVASGHVLVTVHDLDLGNVDPERGSRDGGRGLHLVRALAESSSLARHSAGGKTAWFRLARDA